VTLAECHRFVLGNLAIMATRRPKTIHFWRGELPHWQVEDGRYFVTIHLHGSIPPAGQQRIRQLGEQYRSFSVEYARKQDETLELSRKIFAEMEKWLDRTSPVRHLNRPDLAEMVMEAVKHRNERCIWEMLAGVLMPSHIHLFFELNAELSLKRELEEFKRWTGHRAAQIDEQFQGQRFWQTEWFDHWSRSDEEDERIVEYIRQNPVKAGLVEAASQWAYSCPQSDR
jgi:REP element-mobilizing transposase RayT